MNLKERRDGNWTLSLRHCKQKAAGKPQRLFAECYYGHLSFGD